MAYAKAAAIYRGQHYHNTVISIHDKYNQIRLSFPVAGIKSDYNIGRYKSPSRTIEDYRVFTDNGSLNLEIDYADYKDYDWRNTKIAYDKLTDKDVRDFSRTITRSSVTTRKMPTLTSIMVVFISLSLRFRYILTPEKLRKAIPMSAVTMKVIPRPRRGLGTSEYWSFSRIAAIPTIASIQPIPEPKP